MNLPGTEESYFQRPWVFNQRVDGLFSAEIFVYVDNGRLIRPTENLCWEAFRRWSLLCS